MVASETPFARVRVSNISAGMIHESGPQVHEKEKLSASRLAIIRSKIWQVLTEPGHYNETPLCADVGRHTRREHGQEYGRDDEGDHITQVTKNQGPATTGLVDEQDGTELSDKRDDAVDTLVLEGVVTRDADLSIDGDWIVLYGGDAGYLDGGLQSTCNQEAAESCFGSEEFHVRFRLVLVLIGDGLLDLLKLGKHEGVVHVAMRVQLCQYLMCFLGLALIDKPSVFGQYQLNAAGSSSATYLGDSGKSMIKAVRPMAGKIWIASGTLHWALLVFNCTNVAQETQAAMRAPTPSINCCRAVIRPRMLGWASSAWYLTQSVS